MKTLKKRLAIVLSLILFMTGIFAMGGIAASKKADALSPNYYGGDTVYYFSDSTPILNDNEVRSVAGNMDVVYDIQSLISSQRLAYLVYTGYFWGFDDSSNTVVIVEIKAMKPDSYTLRDLFACLQYQNCKVIFISAYEEYEYDDPGLFMEFVNWFMPCNKDKFGRFLDYSIIDMARQNVGYSFGDFGDWAEIWYNNDWSDIWAETCILLDGRFIGIYDSYINYDAKSSLAYSTFLQRMILDMRYGPFEDERADFEFNMYRKLWQFYADYYLAEWGYNSDYSEIDIWQLMEIWRDSGFNYEDFFLNYGEEYQEYYRDVVWNYFAEGGDEGFEGIFNVFFERNTHILVHIPYSDLFWDITNSAENTEDFIYEFTDVETLYEYFGEVRLYAMGIWILDGSFYDFLLNAQQYLSNYGSKLPIYIWERDPIIWGGDLEIITSDNLFSDYDLSDEYDEEYLKDTLLGLLIEAIYD